MATALSDPLVLIVEDSFSNAVPNSTVTFAVTGGGGVLSTTSVDSNSLGVVTLPAGAWTLGSTVGTNTAVAFLSGTSTDATFTATGTQGSPVRIVQNALPAGTATVATSVGGFSVTVFDAFGNTVSGATVTLSVAAPVATGVGVTSANGSLSVYTITTGVNGVASVAAWTLGTVTGVNTAEAFISGTATSVTFTATGTVDVVSVVNSLITGLPGSIEVGTGTSVISLQLRDQFGNNITTDAGITSVTMAASLSGFTSPSATYVGNGVYQRTFESGLVTGTSVISAVVNGVNVAQANEASIAIVSVIPVPVNSVLAVAPATIFADGTSTSVLTLQLKDQYGNNADTALPTSDITFFTTGGSLLGAVTSLGGGLYAQTLRASSVLETAVITARVQTVTVSSTQTVQFVATPASVSVASGSGQLAVVGTSVSNPLSVTVFDSAGLPVTAVDTVTYVVTGGGGSGSGSATTVNGVATIPASAWTLGNTVGTNTLVVYLPGTAAFATFTATGTQDAGALMVLASGSGQSATVGSAVGSALSVTVFDQYGNTVSGATVTFAAPTGGGGDASLSVNTVTTGVNGVASLPANGWTLGTTVGVNTVVASLVGAAGQLVTFTATGTQGAPAVLNVVSGSGQSAVVGTSVADALVVRVLDGFGNTVSGATVTFATPAGGGGDGALSVYSVTTGVNGQASVAAWTLGSTVGTNTAVAFLSGTSTDATFTATGTQGSPVRIVQNALPAGTATVATSVGLFSVTVFDAFGNTVSGATVTLSVAAPVATGVGVTSTNGSLSVYTITTGVNGVASVASWTLGTVTGVNTAEAFISGTATSVTFAATGTVDVVSVVNSLITGSPGSIEVGTGTSVISLQLRDQFGNNITTDAGITSVTMAASLSGFTSPSATYVGDGVYQRTLTSGLVTGTSVISAVVNGVNVAQANEASIAIVSVIPVPVNSVVSVAPATIFADGTSTSVLTLQLKDQYGNNADTALPISDITFFTTGGSLIGVVTSPSPGVYTQTLQASSVLETAVITARVQTVTVSSTQTVQFVATPASVSVASGSGQLAVVGTSVSNPLSVTVFDSAGLPVTAVDTVTYVVTGGGGSGSGSATTVNGVATIPASAWTLGNTVGTNTLVVYLPGTSAFATFTATGTQDAGALMVLASGSGQSATVGSAVGSALSVTVFDQYGNTVSGATVTFAAPTGGGGDASLSVNTVTTGVNGVASLPANGWTLGTTVGVNTVVASLVGAAGQLVTFTATGTQGAPAVLNVVSGSGQSAVVGTSVADALVVRVLDGFGNTVSGATVTFATPAGGGGDGALSVYSVTTGVNGQASVAAWTLGSTVGTNTAVAYLSGYFHGCDVYCYRYAGFTCSDCAECAACGHGHCCDICGWILGDGF